MVTEPVTFRTEDGLTLEGVLHLPDEPNNASIAVCHPHPQYGGDMHNNVVDAICRAANENGIGALRFNFRGVGHSDGEYEGGTGEQQDVLAALACLRGRDEFDATWTGLAGYSFGAAVSIRAMDRAGARILICVSTPTVSSEVEPPAGDCPVLFVSGDEDEYSDPAELHRIAEEMGERSAVVIMPGVDHFWWGADERLTATVGEFLAKYLAVKETER